MDVGAWLRSIGLEKYEAAFRDNAVDVTVLPKLTADDLRDIGVTAVGDRRKLLDAITSLAAATALDAAPLTTDRRQLTVMFVDLVGSTSLSARLDPEDMRAIIANYHKTVSAAVSAAGGFVAKYMGDGVLAYFGYPRAQENDPERAVDAGLRIVDAAQRLWDPAGDRLHVRVGVATGVVVVGDLIGSGESSERGVVGDTPNLAARLQSVAEPDQVVIAEGTRKLIGDLFDLQDLGALELKGIAGFPHAFAVIRARAVESRFEALHGGALPDLVGREEERDLLARRWTKAKAGQGHVVLISGEPGIGKSRLTADLLARVAAEPHLRMRYFCSPQSADSALFPIIGHMERAAGFAKEDDAKAKLDKLDALLARTGTSPEDAGLIADMLGLADEGRYPPVEAQPPARRQKLLAALTAQIEQQSRRAPIIFVFEDAHWADASSLEAMGRLFDRIADLKALAVVTFRPEFAPPWAGLSHVTALTLNRLTRQEIDALVVRLAGGNSLPESLRHDIVERADGVPLFAEEIAKAAMEAAGEAATRLVSSLPSPDRAVPASLHASLLARLDRLGAAKEVAQVGAAIGRSFSFDLLEAVTGKPAAELGLALQRLVEAGLLFRHGATPRAEYLFKHALIQDAAYGALLREPRRALHARIVAALEAQTPDIGTARPEMLAQHCVEAGQVERGARLWGAAGKLAFARSAIIESEAMLRRALGLIAGLPSAPEMRKDDIEFQIALMYAIINVKGYTAPETYEAAEKARSLVERAQSLGDSLAEPRALLSIYYGFWANKLVAFDGPAILELGRQFLALAERMQDVVAVCGGQSLVAIALIETGSIEAGCQMLRNALEDFKNVDCLGITKVFGSDVTIYFRATLAISEYLLGYHDTAETLIDSCMTQARATNHIPTIMPAGYQTRFARLICGSLDKLETEAREIYEKICKNGLYLYIYKDVVPGLRLSIDGNPKIATEYLSRGLAEYSASGQSCHNSLLMSHLANAYLRSGDLDRARTCIREALDHVERKHERWYEADVHRMAGEIARAERDETEAEACFDRALVVARSQRARSLELRAATSLARMRRDQGRRDEARGLLAPIYAWFTEGFDKPDLRAARDLLDELA